MVLVEKENGAESSISGDILDWEGLSVAPGRGGLPLWTGSSRT